MNWDVAIKEFISIWVVVDPIGTIPVFFAVTVGLSAAQQRAIALKCTTIASLVLLFFIVVGQVLLEALNISLEAFQLAGGIVLFMQQIGTAGTMLAVMLCALMLLLFANPVQRLLGNAGASIISRVMGLILASVAVDNILQAITAYFHLS